MPNTANDRLLNYTEKLNPNNVQAALTALLPGMQHKMQRYLPLQQSVRAKILGICQAAGHSTFSIAGYMGAAMRMWSLQQRLHGNAQAEIGYVVATWTSRGYNATTLGHIRDLVTGMLAP